MRMAAPDHLAPVTLASTGPEAQPNAAKALAARVCQALARYPLDETRSVVAEDHHLIAVAVREEPLGTKPVQQAVFDALRRLPAFPAIEREGPAISRRASDDEDTIVPRR